MQLILVLQIVKLLCELRQAFTCCWHITTLVVSRSAIYKISPIVCENSGLFVLLGVFRHGLWCRTVNVWEASIDLFVLNRYAVYFIGPVYCGSEKLAQNSHVRPVWHISAQLLSLVRLSSWWLQNQTSLFLLHKMLNIGLLPASRVIEKFCLVEIRIDRTCAWLITQHKDISYLIWHYLSCVPIFIAADSYI